LISISQKKTVGLIGRRDLTRKCCI